MKKKSEVLSHFQKPLSTVNVSRPEVGLDKGKGKMPEYEVHHPDDSDSDVSAR